MKGVYDMGKTYKDTANYFRRKGKTKPSPKVKKKINLMENDPCVGLRHGNNRKTYGSVLFHKRKSMRMKEKEELRDELRD